LIQASLKFKCKLWVIDGQAVDVVWRSSHPAGIIKFNMLQGSSGYSADFCAYQSQYQLKENPSSADAE
jgi:hypothetical protein